MANAYWLSDRAWASIEPLMPTNQPGARRVDDRRVISGIIHVLKSGCCWKDCPAVYGVAIRSEPPIGFALCVADYPHMRFFASSSD